MQYVRRLFIYEAAFDCRHVLLKGYMDLQWFAVLRGVLRSVPHHIERVPEFRCICMLLYVARVCSPARGCKARFNCGVVLSGHALEHVLRCTSSVELCNVVRTSAVCFGGVHFFDEKWRSKLGRQKGRARCAPHFCSEFWSLVSGSKGVPPNGVGLSPFLVALICHPSG